MTERVTTPNTQSLPDITGADLVSQVTHYWDGLRCDGQIPARDAIDARALGSALPHVFLAEMVTSRVARLRVCGHRVEDLLGMDMRGMPLSTLFTGAARADLTSALAQVARGVRVTLVLQGETGFGLPALDARLALLPLADAAGLPTRVLGVLDVSGQIGRSPRRFVRATPLALPVAADTPPPARRAPVLRVIKGGRA
ncbi:MAG: PAS domain-containing protein [Rhodobacteraceae bacterium]|nr:PAS domain-containing protein [Paracoccaceae bacterium]TVR48299.1 MAG: PAS domain-containing protein [Paracoccaceae bacterium]